jgi:hypothetical protein
MKWFHVYVDSVSLIDRFFTWSRTYPAMSIVKI